MRLVQTTLALLLGCCAAQASGGANCASEGGPAKVQLDAGITRGMGGPVFSLTASVVIDDPKIAEDLRSSSFAKEQLAQYWLDGEDLRFLLYRERQGDGEFGSVEVEIRTKAAGDEGSYAGTYLIKVFDGGSGEPVSFEGRIACSGE